MLSNKEICIIIPVYNEAENIGRVIEQVKQALPEAGIIVSDDGSVDETKTIAVSCRAVLIESPSNKGKGAALTRGFVYAAGRKFKWIITLDGDGQHDPVFLKDFVRAAGSGKYDIITGCRKRIPGTMPLHRILSNSITSFLVSARILKRIRDSQAGYRMFRTEITKKLRVEDPGFQFESEFLIKAGIAQYRIGHVEISTIYGSEKSKINNVSDTLKFIKLYLKSFFWKKKDIYAEKL